MRRWQRKRRAAYAVLSTLLLTVALSACGTTSATGPAPTPTTPVGAITHVIIVPTKSGHPDSLYIPDPIRVHVGQTITWTNKDTDPHDVSADNGTFYSGPIGTNGSWKWTAKKVGTYHYTCTLHPDMHGTIIVSPA
jgi:plastocyanin